ncbi:MAG: polyprenyl synthetase family protein, partial [Bacteroidetes bacterium]|nr:polyprenyl synthetase family protein [Bacteroidota bacterium]
RTYMKISDYNKKAEDYRHKLNAHISKLLLNLKPDSLYNPIRYFMNSGGKRIRPILLIASAGASNNFKTGQVINQAIAMELLHNFTLIHDDIMDHADLRHGHKTLHTKYDVNIAILCGDNLLAMAFKSLNKNLKFNINDVLNTFSESVITVCEGQSLDKEFENSNNIKMSDYLDMIYRKTAAMISASCKIGALSSNAPAKIIRPLSEFGRYFGMAFQIQDDLLDMEGDNPKFGKTHGSDLIEGKKTFLLLSALQKARGRDLEQLTKLVENKGIMPGAVKKHFEIYRRLNVDFMARETSINYINKALSQLNYLPDSMHKEFLIQFSNQILNRTH